MISSALTHSAQGPEVSEPHPGCQEQKQGNEETLEPGEPVQGAPSPSSGFATQADDNEEATITSIRAAGVALGLRRIPAGFYTVVQHSGLEWRTENRRLSLNNDIVEWDGLIPVPPDLSATIGVGIYASFEFQPMLGDGEQLRTLTITVEQLLNDSGEDPAFTFSPMDGDVVSPCSSLSVIVKRRKREGSDPPTSRAINLHCSTTESRGQLEYVTNEGHNALLRYRKHWQRQDLDRSIEQYELALSICPPDDPRRAASQSNMAMATFIRCRVDDTDHSFNVPLALYRDALFARPVGHPDRPSTLIHLAAVCLARFEKLRDEVDAAQAEALLQETMELSSEESHDNRAAILMLQLHARLSMVPLQAGSQSSVEHDPTTWLADEDPWTFSVELLRRYDRFGDLDNLQWAISLLEASVKSVSVEDPQYLEGLTNFGGALLRRFHRLGDLGDMEKAISMFGDVVDLAPDGRPDKPVYLSNLGSSLLNRFQRLGTVHDLEQGISRFQDAVDLIPDRHPDKHDYLNNLGSSFLTRFERLGELSDLEQAISRLESAVDFTPDGHFDKPRYLGNLASSFIIRFERLGDLSDLEQAISRHRDAVDLTPDGYPDKPRRLSNLGDSFRARFERLGEPSDLEQAILRQQQAVDLAPDGHHLKPAYFNNLGNSLITRFKHFGELSDLEQASARFRDAVDLTPDGHPNQPDRLNNLGGAFLIRFEHLGELSDLEQAISRHSDAVDVTPNDHPHKASNLDNLGNSFLIRFERLGELTDLEQSISRHRNAVDLTPDGHPDKPRRLNNLGNSFRACFERIGELSDLDQAISRYRDAVNITPDGHPDKPTRLNNLGKSFFTRFKRLGELHDLEQAISRQRDATDLTPDGHPDKPSRFNDLGGSILIRFECLGNLRDLEQAISRLVDAVDLTPNDHPDKPRHLGNLASSFLTRFERLGVPRDLEHAISRFRDAIDVTPDGHFDKPGRLNSLGSCFLCRFRRLGELHDLKQAILRYGDAVDLTPDGHPGKPSHFNNLGNSFLARLERLGNLSDLEQAILRHGDAVDLTPDGHTDKPIYLSNLGNSFLIRFERLGELRDLEKAISRHRDAVDLTPDGHPGKPIRLNNLGGSFIARFKSTGQPRDLEQAISGLGDAVDLTPDGHPEKPSYLYNLGDFLRTRFDRLGQTSDLEQAISLYSHTVCSSAGATSTRFRASQNWISCARVSNHRSLLPAYSFAISLLPQLAWIGLSLTDRYRELVQGADVVREAAAAALDCGRPELAVEWLEQGRSIVWGELFQLRSSYDELSAVHPDHARRLRELSVALEHAGAAREKSMSSPSKTMETLEQEVDRHRMLAIERDELLQEIRRLSGFERFLLHKELSQLRASAQSGPVIILNAAETRCDALIVLAAMDNVIHVPLPKFTLERSESLQTSMKSLIRREGKSIPHETPSEWEPILSALWKCVVKPVLHSLAISTPEDLARIFWCPTGPFTFLPIHAAGFYATEYSRPGHKVFDFIVSSYVPTLSILMPSPELDAASSSGLRFLAVRQSPSDGLSKLPGVHAELEYIKGVIQSSPSAQTTFVEPSLGTVEEVLGMMKEADWVHFACHGIQDAANPTDSGLCLADGRRLKLPDIITLSRPRGGLAFLSACQTATGDKKLSDEAIHIAAGMLFAGYGGVVGTMWSISDKLAPGVARDVYEQLFRKGTMPDYREAARALQNAVRSLRDGGASFREWLPFIYVGL